MTKFIRQYGENGGFICITVKGVYDMTIKRDILGKDLEVALQVYDSTNKKGDPIYFSKLVKILDGRISRNRISQALDRLFDEGILTAEFKKINQKWARVYKVSGEAEGLLEDIYNQVVKT